MYYTIRTSRCIAAAEEKQFWERVIDMVHEIHDN